MGNSSSRVLNCRLVGPFRQLLTFSDLPLKGPLNDDQLVIIKEAGILFDKGVIREIGHFSDLVNSAKLLEADICYMEEDFVCLPGFVDSHCHMCFEGSRSKDYALRNSGKSYLEIAKSGGGIWDTVVHTREATKPTLEQSLFKRVSRHLTEGITTMEVKSGYGLSLADELKMLEVIQAVNSFHKGDLIPTCLAAHVLPKDFGGSHQEYLTEMSSELFPILKSKNLTNRIDIFIEEEAFSVDLGRLYLQNAQKLGFDITIHADQFSVGASKLAVELKAVSADHLEASGDNEVNLLAKSDVIATALPGASLGLGCDFTPARKILDAGGSLAIASDWNPGSAPMGDLLCQASVLGAYEKLSNAEVLAGITYRSSATLKLHDRGRLSKGLLADFNLFECKDYREILYHQGKLKPARVWKRGELIIPCL